MNDTMNPLVCEPEVIEDFDTRKLSRPAIKKILAKRDGGWFCHYCNKALWPIPLYDAAMKQWNQEQELLNYPPRPISPSFSAEGWGYAEIDHIIPRSKVKNEMLSNLVLCCHSCNSRKGAREYSRYAPSQGVSA